VVLGGIYLLLTKVSNLKLSKNPLTLFAKIDNKKMDLENGQYIRNKDFMLIVNKVDETVKKQSELQFRTKIERQVSFASEKLTELKATLENIYFKLLKSKKESVEKNFEHFKCYSAVLEFSTRNCLDVFQISFKSNNFMKMDEEEFSEYVERKFQLMFQKTLDAFATLYACEVVKPSEVCEEIKKEEDKLKKMVREIYENAKEESFKVEKEKEKLEDELNNFLFTYLEFDLKKMLNKKMVVS
jgi:hypothetical protein